MTKHNGGSAAELFELCRDYIERSKAALATQPFAPPDISELAGRLLPDSGIKSARAHGKDHFQLEWPFVAIKVAGGKNERYVDPGIFAVMQLFAVAGRKLRLAPSKTKRGEPERGYLCYGGKTHSLLRQIADTPPGFDTRYGRSDAHYDCRRITLRTIPKPKVMAAGQETRRKGKGRKEAIAFAVKSFSRAELSGLNLTPEEFERLLREMFELADAMHERSLQKKSTT